MSDINPNIRLSDVDGYTIVERKGRRPRIHLLRPWNECNTEKGKSGSDTVRVEGGREHLATTLSEMGFNRGGVACRRCFPLKAEDDVETLVVEHAPASIGDQERVSRLDSLPE